MFIIPEIWTSTEKQWNAGLKGTDIFAYRGVDLQ